MAKSRLLLDLTLGMSIAFSAFAPFGLSQTTPTPPPTGGGTGGTGGGTTGGRTTTIPTSPTPTTRQQDQIPTMPAVIFLSGRVMMDDGSVPPDNVVIERVCGAIVRPEAYTDSKGRFAFQVGQNTSTLMMGDASLSGADGRDGRDPMGHQGTSPLARSTRMGESNLMGCELRAKLAGYRSDALPLSGRRSLDNPEIGTIVLHRLANVEGTTISATSMAAPKEAKKAYEKGLQAVRKNKWPEAQKELEQAVASYPKYAIAWYELGNAYHAQNNLEKARDAYEHAMSADSRFMKPYMPMALLAMQDKRWADAARYTEQVLRLDPVDYTNAYLYNAIANVNLQKFDIAEKSVREGMKLDPNNTVPRFEYVLGVILANRQDFPGAVQFLTNYLDRVPDGTDTTTVRSQLAEFQRLAGQPAAQAQTQK